MIRAALTCLALSSVCGPCWALDPCAALTPAEAGALLGEAANPAKPAPAGCVIDAAGRPEDRIVVSLATVAPEDQTRLLKHLDEARGDEIPSLHGEPWYEQSVSDPEHPTERVFVIWRDRTSLTLDLTSARQADAQGAFEKLWLPVALRLPTDE